MCFRSIEKLNSPNQTKLVPTECLSTKCVLCNTQSDASYWSHQPPSAPDTRPAAGIKRSHTPQLRRGRVNSAEQQSELNFDWGLDNHFRVRGMVTARLYLVLCLAVLRKQQCEHCAAFCLSVSLAGCTAGAQLGHSWGLFSAGMCSRECVNRLVPAPQFDPLRFHRCPRMPPAQSRPRSPSDNQ